MAISPHTLTVTAIVGGEKIVFVAHSKYAELESYAGVYMFTKQENDGSHTALYVGETGDFHRRINANHHKWLCANSYGMTHILTFTTFDYARRMKLERGLIATYSPVCNDQAGSCN